MLHTWNLKLVGEILKEIKVIEEIEEVDKFYDDENFKLDIFLFEGYIRSKYKDIFDNDVSLGDNIYRIYGCFAEFIIYCIFQQKETLMRKCLYSYRIFERKGVFIYPFIYKVFK